VSIDRYVATLRARLPLPNCQAQELADEVRAHLEDAARDLQMAGLAPQESEREAVRRCGPPEQIVAALTQARRSERRRSSAAGPRLFAALLVAAVTLAALGGNVASAYTSGAHSGARSAPIGAHRAPHTTAVVKGQH
jgi:hypothetical protein